MWSQLTQSKGVDTEASVLQAVADYALHYFTCLFHYCLQFLSLNYKLFAGGAELDEQAKYGVHGDLLPPIFCSLQETVATVLGIVRPKLSAVSIVRLMKIVSQFLHCSHLNALQILHSQTVQLSIPTCTALTLERALRRRDLKCFTPD